VVRARSGIAGRLKNALAHRGRTETTVLLEEPEALDAETIQENEKTAKAEAERIISGLAMFTDGSRLDGRATRYAVTWQNGQSWVGIKNYMGYNQEAYDTACAALARALEEAAKCEMVPERVTIFVGGCPITDEREGEGETERDVLSMMGDGSVRDEDVLSGLLLDN